MTVAYKIDRIAGETLALMPPPHGFPVEPSAWYAPLTTLGAGGAVVQGLTDLSGNGIDLAQFGTGGKFLHDDGVHRFGRLETTHTQRLQSAFAATTLTVVGVTRVGVAVNATMVSVAGYNIVRDNAERLSVTETGKTSTNFIRLDGAGLGWIVWCAVLNGSATNIRVRGVGVEDVGTVDGTGTTSGVIAISSNTNAVPVDVAELAVFSQTLPDLQADQAMDAMYKRWRGLL